MTQTAAITSALAYFDDQDGYFADLARRVAVPTESQNPDRLAECYRYLEGEMRSAFEAMGYECRVYDNPFEGNGPVRDALKDASRDSGPSAPDIDDDWGEPRLTWAEKVHAWNTFEVLAFKTGDPDNPVSAIPPRACAACQLRFVTRERCAVLPNPGGSICDEVFQDVLEIPFVWMPLSYAGCSQHAPDEHVLWPLTRQGLEIVTVVYWDPGDPNTTPPLLGRRDGRQDAVLPGN